MLNLLEKIYVTLDGIIKSIKNSIKISFVSCFLGCTYRISNIKKF